MNPARWVGLAGLLLGMTACGGSKGRLDASALAPSSTAKKYPTFFFAPSSGRGLAGIGFSPLNRFRSDQSFAPAVEMACRQLSWSIHARVQGERLFERTASGNLEFRGENIELRQVPEITPEACHLETLRVDQHVWIVARREKGGSLPQGASAFGDKPPQWMTEMPRDAGWLYGLGSASIAYRDEPGSWELATYHALIELAFGVVVRTSQLEKLIDGVLMDATILEVDAVLEGFEVVGRWRDQKNALVLGRVPASGAIPLLADEASE